MMSIPLDPALSPTENLQRIFKRARKAERRAQKAQQQLGGLRERLDEIDALRWEFDALGEGGERGAADLDEFIKTFLKRFGGKAA